MSDGMRRELVYLSSYATNRYFIPNWGKFITNFDTLQIFHIPFLGDKSAVFWVFFVVFVFFPPFFMF